jgi:hypothetical protein
MKSFGPLPILGEQPSKVKKCDIQSKLERSMFTGSA